MWRVLVAGESVFSILDAPSPKKNRSVMVFACALGANEVATALVCTTIVIDAATIISRREMAETVTIAGRREMDEMVIGAYPNYAIEAWWVS